MGISYMSYVKDLISNYRQRDIIIDKLVSMTETK